MFEVKNPCCPSTRRRENHKHLENIPGIRNGWPLVHDYINPNRKIEIVISRLNKEGRRLDQIDGGEGSLEKALAKELYGDENSYDTR